jgi:hypothetical protein
MSQPWERRDRKVTRRSTSMRVTGRSAFVIAAAQAKRDALKVSPTPPKEPTK